MSTDTSGSEERTSGPAPSWRNVTIFLFSSVCSFVANGIFIYMYVITSDAAAGVSAFTGLVLTLIFLPMVLGALFGGAIADRLSRRQILIVSAFCLSVIAAASAGALAAPGAVSQMLVLFLALSFGLATAPVYGTRLALVGDIGAPQQAARLFVLLNVANTASFGLGPFIAGFFVAFATPSAALAVSAALYGAAGLSLLMIKIRAAAPGNGGEGGLRLLRDTLAGLQMLLGNRRLGFHLLTTAITTTIVLGTVQALFPKFALDVLGLHEFARGAAYAAFAVGLTLGGLAPALAGPIRPTTARLLLPCLLAGILLALCALWADPAASTLALGLSGFALGVRGSMIPFVLHREAPPTHRGRLMNFYAAIMNGGPIVGGLGFGLLTDATNVRFAIAAAGAAALTGALLALLHPGARQSPDAAPAT